MAEQNQVASHLPGSDGFAAAVALSDPGLGFVAVADCAVSGAAASPAAQMATDIVRAHGTNDMPVWGKRLSEDIPPGPAKQPAKRMTLHLVVEYLAAIQRAE